MERKTTSLKAAHDDEINMMMMNSPMKIADAAAAYREPIGKNERPFDLIVKKKNNELVDEWKKSLLLPLADASGCVPAGRVNNCLMFFLEGKEMDMYKKYEDHLPKYDMDKAMFWLNIFRKSTIEEIHAMGRYVVGVAWNMIRGAIRDIMAEKRWDAVYSKTTSSLERDKLANDNPDAMNGRPFPLGIAPDEFVDIALKVETFLSRSIKPNEVRK